MSYDEADTLADFLNVLAVEYGSDWTFTPFWFSESSGVAIKTDCLGQSGPNIFDTMNAVSFVVDYLRLRKEPSNEETKNKLKE